jgi:hypothetical protein
MIQAQQLGQPARVDLVTLVALFHGGILSWITHHQSGDVWLQQVVQPGGPGSFLQGDVQAPALPLDKLENSAGLGFDDAFHHQLASRIHGRDGDAFPVDIHADILRVVVVHWGRSFR